MKHSFNSNQKCRFCEIIKNGNNDKVNDIDRPIYKSENYIALASIGAIIEGWTLIIPEKHVFSMNEIYSDVDFIQFTNKIIDKIKSVYKKKCIIFEHGANRKGSLISCGTDHGHLHILPYEISLLSDIKKDNKKWIECTSKEIEGLVNKKEYWFYAENVCNVDDVLGYLHIIESPESQFFRKIIAEKENCLEMFSYKEFDFIENSLSTYEKLLR